MKKTLIFLLILSVSMCTIFTVFAHEDDEEQIQNVTSNETYEKSVITSRLLEKINTQRSATIPVTIQIVDDIDLEAIELMAMERCNLSYDELEEMESYAETLSEEESIIYQQDILAVYDKIRSERNKLLKEYYKKLNNDFIEEQSYTGNYTVGMFTPFVRNVDLSVSEIYELAESNKVAMIDFAETYDETEDYASINDTYAIIRGNIAVNAGYTGSGIRVGTVEEYHPIFDNMGTDANNITITNSGNKDEHPTIVCGIIKKMAPGCSIYTMSYAATATSDNRIIHCCETLIDSYNVHVINMSCGDSSEGEYTSVSAELDALIKNSKVTIVTATGRTGYEVSQQSLATQAIAVGAVISSGTSNSATTAYSYWYASNAKENSGQINKPDVCAPGQVTIYNYTGIGTSYAAPYVTGTVVQMMSRNAALVDKPTALKAAIMASAVYSASNHSDNISGTLCSNIYGAGVVDAGFCYDVARNGRWTYLDIAYSTQSVTYNVYRDTTSTPFRIACTWEVFPHSYIDSYGNTVGIYGCNNYDINVYKDGVKVASSVATSYATGTNIKNTNYEIVEIPAYQHGAGYFQVEIVLNGAAQSSGFTRLGLAWEQP